jgi:hypothetical protein
VIQLEQKKTFENLLSAIYRRQYKIDSVKELASLTTLADYYRALPTVSHTVVESLMAGWFFAAHPYGRFCGDLFNDALSASLKLRNSLLLNELLLLSLGPWSSQQHGRERYRLIKDPNMQRLAKGMYHEVCALVAQVQQELMNHVTSNAVTDISNEARSTLRGLMNQLATPPDGDDGEEVSLPKFYRALYEWKTIDTYGSDYSFPFRGDYTWGPNDALKRLLKNNLRFYAGSKAGERGYFEDYFLSAERLSDEDLPWDTTQTDW